MSRNFISTSIALLAAWAGTAAYGATLEEHLSAALRGNPRLVQAQQQYAAGQARIGQVRALPDPMMEVSLLVESDAMRRGVDEVMVTQAFPWFGTLRAAGNAASAEAEALAYALQAAELELASSLAEAHFEYAYLGQALAVTQENLRLLEGLTTIAEQRVSGGGALNDYLRFQVETGRLQDEVSSLEEALVSQRARLNSLMGRPAGDAIERPTIDFATPAPIDPASLLRTLLEKHPRLQMLQRQVESEAARLAVARLDGYPELMLGVAYMPDRSKGAMGPGGDEWQARVGFSIPLWREKYRGRQREVLADQRAAEAAMQDLSNTLSADLAVNLSRLRDAQRRIELYSQRLLPLAQQSLENLREGYRSGQATVLDLIDAERSLLDLQLEQWRAIADLRKAEVSLALLTGQPLPHRTKESEK